MTRNQLAALALGIVAYRYANAVAARRQLSAGDRAAAEASSYAREGRVAESAWHARRAQRAHRSARRHAERGYPFVLADDVERLVV